MPIQEVTIASPYAELSGSLFSSKAPNSTGVLFLSGYESHRQKYTEYAAALSSELGATCLTVDLRGHGETGGSLRNLYAGDHAIDSQSAYDFLAEQAQVDSDRMGVAAVSYGGYVAILLCKKRSPKSLILRAPAIYDEIKPDGSLNPAGPLQVLADYPGSLTVVASNTDGTVPEDGINACVSVAKDGQLKQMDGAKHVLSDTERGVFIGMLKEWAGEL